VSKTFPVLVDCGGTREELALLKQCPRRIPWSIIASHEAQAIRNHGQDLAKLANRGGLHPVELYAVLHDRKWERMPLREAVEYVQRLVQEST
jgi:hypothetical protein